MKTAYSGGTDEGGARHLICFTTKIYVFSGRPFKRSPAHGKNMYQPPAFREEGLEILYALIRAHPPGRRLSPLGVATLSLTLCRSHWSIQTTKRPALTSPKQALDRRFEGWRLHAGCFPWPAGVHQTFLVCIKEHGRVIPTWNYAVVRVRGTPCVDDPGWLRLQIGALTSGQEDHRPKPWRVTNAPELFIEGQLRAIIGIEMPISIIEGKWKVSQNRPAADGQDVYEGLGCRFRALY
jgi:transcriptional regulator